MTVRDLTQQEMHATKMYVWKISKKHAKKTKQKFFLISTDRRPVSLSLCVSYLIRLIICKLLNWPCMIGARQSPTFDDLLILAMPLLKARRPSRRRAQRQLSLDVTGGWLKDDDSSPCILSAVNHSPVPITPAAQRESHRQNVTQQRCAGGGGWGVGGV